MIIDRPVKFQGSAAEQADNYFSHEFVDYQGDGNYRCAMCDCKPWYLSASYRCGDNVPREIIIVHEEDDKIIIFSDQKGDSK
jgi:hypothetical protein